MQLKLFHLNSRLKFILKVGYEWKTPGKMARFSGAQRSIESTFLKAWICFQKLGKVKNPDLGSKDKVLVIGSREDNTMVFSFSILSLTHLKNESKQMSFPKIRVKT